MSESRTLRQLLEPGFADGYEAFKEMIDWGSDLSTLTVEQRAWLRQFELVSVAMIEGLNRVETEFETEPSVNVTRLWNACGAAMASVNAQAFTDEGKLAVRREMIRQFKEGYDRAMKAGTGEDQQP